MEQDIITHWLGIESSFWNGIYYGLLWWIVAFILVESSAKQEKFSSVYIINYYGEFWVSQLVLSVYLLMIGNISTAIFVSFLGQFYLLLVGSIIADGDGALKYREIYGRKAGGEILKFFLLQATVTTIFIVGKWFWGM